MASASTEEVVNALMEYLVDPHLPLKSSAIKEPPSLSQQLSVAKQLHAVVLLYNYYQRKQNPQAQNLDFESFCKLAVALKPALVSYMKFMNQSDPTGSKDTDNDLSVAEKAIQDACNISCALDASKNVPSINKWLIAKASVLLLDSKKETCWLLYSSVTDGVWSLLEKNRELPSAEIEGMVEGKHPNKKRRTSMRPVTVEQKDDDSGFQQFAFLAVKDATGISRSDLVVLEKHVVYSLTKEKTASCFYIMQCKSINQDIQIPVKEIFESLQGPLVKKSSGSWSTTEVVEYFHLLPYANIMSAFLLSQSVEEPVEKIEAKTPDESYEALIGTKSDRINLEISEAKHGDGREKVSRSAVGQEATVVDGHQRIRKSEEAGRDSSIKNTEIVDFSDDKLSDVNLECLNDTSKKVHHENSRDYKDSTAKELYDTINRPRTQEDKAEELVKSTKSCEINDFNGMELAGAHPEPLEVQVNDDYHFSRSPTRPQRMDMDACIPCSKNGNSKDRKLITKVYHHEKKRTRVSGGEIIGGGVICKAERTDEGKAGKECGLSTISPNRNGISVAHTAFVPYQHDTMDIGDLQTVLASKEKALTQSALRVLLDKREKLCHQQHKIEDEIALCDKSIQRILDGMISISGFSSFFCFSFFVLVLLFLHDLVLYGSKLFSSACCLFFLLTCLIFFKK
uniref:Uncharacterized protein isoform X1 n=1 Tax=Nicotiana tabacum TaxID=4097 RepID=A0A1S4CB78_TOBAC|nr:PREDICTED: uncharacterized protein LOC107816976 isoform X1 [Nicotiana tabacum]